MQWKVKGQAWRRNLLLLQRRITGKECPKMISQKCLDEVSFLLSQPYEKRYVQLHRDISMNYKIDLKLISTRHLLDILPL
ncbi:hypothetical protein L6452_09987 [Arctium lappa]|uniref:Uncharacterized protein n=1 Tax=Arctium lappa TaxID=4217 RepID=A0ACB9DMI5_ARCLA|nr:hypothetical protein L6452_09987 [Arctium lappa]